MATVRDWPAWTSGEAFVQLDIRLDTPVVRAWHVDLVDRLSAIPHVHVRVRHEPRDADRDAKRLDRLMTLERWLHRLEPGNLVPVDDAAIARTSGSDQRSADLVINLGATPVENDRVWTVVFDSVPGEDAAVLALRRGRQPQVSVVDDSGETIAAGRPGSEQPGLFATALADTAAGVVALLVGAVRGSRFTTPAPAEGDQGRPRSFAELTVRRLVGACMHVAYRALYRAPHWRVGWRSVEDDDVFDLGAHPESGWRDLPDDGYHFYADPFPFEHDGVHYIFVEDYDHRVGKGVISVVECDPMSGPAGVPRPVLTHDVHLSYPFVLEHDGDIWMIPETSGAGTVELYRATSFPDEWQRHSVLLDGIEASDATPFVHDGRWWLSATVRDGGSFSDSLHLWHAPDLRGPWTPHQANPVLIDSASARPAGSVVIRDGRLLRPTQDCRDGYGAALTLTEVTRLDEESFEQRVVAHLEASDQYWPGRRLHTLNRAGALEVVDGSRMSPRFWRPAYRRETAVPQVSSRTAATRFPSRAKSAP